MGTTLNVATLLPGRSMEVDAEERLTSVTRKYQVLRATSAPLDAETLSTITGLPAIGAAHPSDSDLTVASYRLAEDSNGLRWVVDVVYSRDSSRPPEPNRAPRGSAELSRGWTMQEIQIDLVADAITGLPVLNSAGEPFDSVPQVPRALPVFRMERKETTAIATLLAMSGKVNSDEVSIDGVDIPIHAGRLVVTQEKLYDDPDDYTSKFTYEIAIMSNLVDLGAEALTDIGWDKALVQSGFIYNSADGKIRAMETDEETLTPRPSPMPVLLDADGYRLADDADPVIIRIATMQEVAFGDLFDEDDEEEEEE